MLPKPEQLRHDGAPRQLSHDRPLSLPCCFLLSPHVYEKRRSSFSIHPLPPTSLPLPFHYPYRPLSSSSLRLPFPRIALASLSPRTSLSFFQLQNLLFFLLSFFSSFVTTNPTYPPLPFPLPLSIVQHLPSQPLPS